MQKLRLLYPNHELQFGKTQIKISCREIVWGWQFFYAKLYGSALTESKDTNVDADGEANKEILVERQAMALDCGPMTLLLACFLIFVVVAFTDVAIALKDDPIVGLALTMAAWCDTGR